MTLPPPAPTRRTGFQLKGMEMATETVKMVAKDCGKHWGFKPGTCAKCGHFAKLDSNPKYKAGIQYSGTPWIAAIGDPQNERALK